MQLNKEHLYYLASPFSHRTAEKERERFIEAATLAGYLMQAGFFIFAPIPHSYPIEEYGIGIGKKTGLFWLNQDFKILDKCDALMVATMPGWKESFGVQEEIKYAQINNKPVYYVNPETRIITVESGDA